MKEISLCPVCGGRDFSFHEILWPELVSDWQLSSFEIAYINRQQGFFCTLCNNNMRSMALADAILYSYGFAGPLMQFVESDLSKNLKVLEINEAGGLSSVLSGFPNHKLVCYPDYDMTALSFDAETFDLVLHSDTLEHVSRPVAGLTECCRVLVSGGGRCIFTVPIIVGRFTRSRVGLKDSCHDTSEQAANDYTVYTEFGVDVWRFAIEAGFTSTRIHSFEYPAGLAIEVNK